APPQAATHLIVAPPTTDGGLSEPALSPDGRFVAIAADRLYVREFGSFDARPLPATEGATLPFVSANSKWVGFFANGKIKKVAGAGGDPLTICDANSDSPGAAWGPNDTIVFSPGWNTPLFTVPAEGGQPRQLTTVDGSHEERGHWWAKMMPDNRHAI